MKQLILLLILFTLFLIPCYAQEKSELADKLNARLESQVSVINQKSCIDNSGFTFKNGVSSSNSTVRTDLKLNVDYKNSGKYPIILHKGSGIVGSYRVSASDFNSKLLSEDGDIEYLALGEGRKEEDTPSDDFVILQPGQFYTNQTELRLLPSQYASYSNSDHLLKLFLFTTSINFNSANNPDELRQKWLKIGYFWFEGTTTVPLQIHFSDYKDLAECEKEK